MMLPVRFYPSFLYLVLSFLFLQIYIADLTQFFFKPTQLGHVLDVVT
jgi:hypothetical protein